MQFNIRLLGTMTLVLLAAIEVLSTVNSSTREKIAMHKAWLAQRSHTSDPSKTSQSPRTFLVHKSIEPKSESKVSYLRELAKYKQDQMNRRTTPNPNFNEVILIEPSNEPIHSTTPVITFSESLPFTVETFATSSLPPLIVTLSSENFTKPVPILTEEITTTTSSSVATQIVAVPTDGVSHVKRRRRTHHASFSSWGKWSVCSRSCGSGVTSQQRHCFTRHQAENGTVEKKTSTNCIGLLKRFRVCNEQSCPDTDPDFREWQCSLFNNLTFETKQYKWEAYIKDDAECELNCKPTDMDMFAMLQDRVADGTSCSEPVQRSLSSNEPDRKAVCVDGLCKAIHSGGLIAGSYMNDGAVRCGHLLCKPIVGVFTDNPLQEGYSLVATIPRGASNISVTELKHSSNRLALRTSDEPFFVNGNESEESQSGIYEAADAVFDYHRIGGDEDVDWKRGIVTEWITSTGPISEAVDIMVLANDRNPGIKFEYLMPVIPTNEHVPPTSDEYSYESESSEASDLVTTSNEIPNARNTLKSSVIQTTTTTTTTTTTPASHIPKPKRKRRFLWKVTGFSECSKSCGSGLKNPIIRCVRESPLRVFVSKKCEHLPKPTVAENIMRCNTQPCPGYWKIGDWSKCECRPNHRHMASQRRDVKCVQELAVGKVIQVPAAACTEEHPAGQQKCECRSAKTEIAAKKPRPNVSMVADQAMVKPLRTKPVKVVVEKRDQGVWLMSEWSGHCTTGCGPTGAEYRTVFCDRATKFVDRCELAMTPESARHCESTEQTCNNIEWLVGEWGKCSGDCFNLTQTRTVRCVRGMGVEDDEACAGSERPLALRKCEPGDVSYCGDRWHYSQWSECTKKCGSGIQRRTVKCLRLVDQEMRESDGCRYLYRQPAYQTCNKDDCDATTASASVTATTTTEYVHDARVDLIQNDIAPDCIDALPNCSVAKVQHLCGYTYFQQYCCITCNQVENRRFSAKVATRI